MGNGLMTRIEAAEYLSVSVGTLAVWACTRRVQVPFVKLGRAVRYRKSDLDAWLSKQTVHPTTSAPARYDKLAACETR